jgi:hypothetical protein
MDVRRVRGGGGEMCLRFCSKAEQIGLFLFSTAKTPQLQNYIDEQKMLDMEILKL